MSLFQQVRAAARTRLVTQLPSNLTGAATPTVYTVAPRQQAVLPYVVIERVSDVREQAFDDTVRVTTLDFQCRIVALAEGTNPAATMAQYENAVMRILERHKFTGLTGWAVSEINYLSTLTLQENEDALSSVLEFTLLGQATA